METHSQEEVRRANFIFLIPLILLVVIYTLNVYGNEDLYDRFYDDDTTSTLNFFSNDNWTQIHNFWDDGDADWALFNADPHRVYTINVTDQATSCNAAIYVYHESDLVNPIITRDDWGPGGGDELISWNTGNTSGTIFVKVTQSPYSSELYGEGTTYTLTIAGAWGSSTGLATITGVCTSIGPLGGILKVGAGGVYTKPEKNIPMGALIVTTELVMDDPGDIGNNPWNSHTQKWLIDHPHNASIVHIYTEHGDPVTFAKPATLKLQFVNDGPTMNTFTIDDIPPGGNPDNMRIYEWDGVGWYVLPGEQIVSGDTVTGIVNSLGTGLFAVGLAEPTSEVKDWMLY
jgi:hypothetical protein